MLSCVWLAGCTGNLPWEGGHAQGTAAPTKLQIQPGLQIAVVMPMQGKNTPLGKAMLNAAILANYDIHNSDITLIPLDQNSVIKNPSLLTAAHATIVVGPLTAEATRALQPFARQNHIHILSLSNDPSLSDDNTVVLGYRVETEVTRILDYAQSRGKNHILAVIPKDVYGDAIIAALSPQQIAQMQLIQFSNVDELQAGLKTVATPPDAVFIPISGKNLPPVLTVLAAAGLTPDKTQYISTGVWDDVSARQIPALEGAWYPSADPQQVQSYLQHYQAQYGAQPPRLSALGYNAVAMIAILERKSPDNIYSKSVLTNPSGFAGVDGLFRIMADGSVRRALAIVEIRQGAPTMIDAPPESTALTK